MSNQTYSLVQEEQEAFEIFQQEVIEAVSADFYTCHSSYLKEYKKSYDPFEELTKSLFYKNYLTVEESAAIVERFFAIYICRFTNRIQSASDRLAYYHLEGFVPQDWIFEGDKRDYLPGAHYIRVNDIKFYIKLACHVNEWSDDQINKSNGNYSAAKSRKS